MTMGDDSEIDSCVWDVVGDEVDEVIIEWFVVEECVVVIVVFVESVLDVGDCLEDGIDVAVST
ncbi:hypothetical protein G210_0885 [Candida maltosa Xu316]|uniref:Uncharacterized protein n=1 Tax=Candida maltosa (strain Xu316) TaxID=1245528 RepID=M3J8W5_CANMX|nr:hypothetical protein G210_0885 [Candida maltosa Xu316]